MNIPEWVSTKVRVGRDRDVITRKLHGETLESIVSLITLPENMFVRSYPEYLDINLYWRKIQIHKNIGLKPMGFYMLLK